MQPLKQPNTTFLACHLRKKKKNIEHLQMVNKKQLLKPDSCMGILPQETSKMRFHLAHWLLQEYVLQKEAT